MHFKRCLKVKCLIYFLSGYIFYISHCFFICKTFAFRNCLFLNIRNWNFSAQHFLLSIYSLHKFFSDFSPYAYIDPLHTNMNQMFVGLFKDALNEYSYAAEIAGLHYNLDCSPYGIYVIILIFLALFHYYD